MPGTSADWNALTQRRVEDNKAKIIRQADFDENGVYQLEPGDTCVLVELGAETTDDDKVVKLPPIAQSAFACYYVRVYESADISHTDGKVTLQGGDDMIDDTNYSVDLDAPNDRAFVQNIAGEYWHQHDLVQG